MLLYRFVPGRRLRLLDALAGAITTAILLLAISFASSRIYDNVTRLSIVYGSLTAALVFLYSVYLYASALLFGGQVAAAWSAPADPGGEPAIAQIKRALLGARQDTERRPGGGDDDAGPSSPCSPPSSPPRGCLRRRPPPLRRRTRRRSRRATRPSSGSSISPSDAAPGEPYVPIDVNLLFDEPTVALRGPWRGADLMKVGAERRATSRAGLYEYHLDFPGDALNPGCELPELVAATSTRATSPRCTRTS